MTMGRVINYARNSNGRIVWLRAGYAPPPECLTPNWAWYAEVPGSAVRLIGEFPKDACERTKHAAKACPACRENQKAAARPVQPSPVEVRKEGTLITEHALGERYAWMEARLADMSAYATAKFERGEGPKDAQNGVRLYNRAGFESASKDVEKVADSMRDTILTLIADRDRARAERDRARAERDAARLERRG